MKKMKVKRLFILLPNGRRLEEKLTAKIVDAFWEDTRLDADIPLMTVSGKITEYTKRLGNDVANEDWICIIYPGDAYPKVLSRFIRVTKELKNQLINTDVAKSYDFIYNLIKEENCR